MLRREGQIYEKSTGQELSKASDFRENHEKSVRLSGKCLYCPKFGGGKVSKAFGMNNSRQFSQELTKRRKRNAEEA